MKKEITFLLLLVAVSSCVSQQIKKNEISFALEENISRIEFSKLLFFTKELIQLGIDTSFQSKFNEKLKQHNSIKQETVGDQREYDLVLFLLYRNLAAEKNHGREYQKGQDFFLQLLMEKKEINFSVDEKLIIQQIDGTKRSLINGYDEGTADESSFIFFCYDPLLYKKVLLKHDLSDDWRRTGIFLCNHLRDNENPIAIRSPLREKVITMLSRKETKNEFKDIVKEITECDVSSNLND